MQDRLAGEVKLIDGTTVGAEAQGVERQERPILRSTSTMRSCSSTDALLQRADLGLELLDELTECAILGLKVDVARYAG